MLRGTDRTLRGLVAVEPAARGSRRSGRYSDGWLPLTIYPMGTMAYKPVGHGRLCCPVQVQPSQYVQAHSAPHMVFSVIRVSGDQRCGRRCLLYRTFFP